MKKRKRIDKAALALCALFAFACDAPSDSENETTLSKVRAESKDAVSTLATYGAEQRAELEARSNAALDALASDVDEAQLALERLSDEFEDEARENLEASIARAEALKEAAVAQIEASKQATQEQWGVAQTRLAATLDELDEARREIAEAIAGEASERAS